MQRIKVSPNFYLDEFVDPVTYFTTNDCGLSMIDKRLFDLAQLLRDKYGKPIGINGWWKHLPKEVIEDYSPSRFNAKEFLSLMEKKRVPVWSGIRTTLCKIGSKYSAHKLFKAIDPKGNQVKFMQIVRDNSAEFYKLGLRRVEDIRITRGWLHMDTNERNTIANHINVVDLKSVVERIKII